MRTAALLSQVQAERFGRGSDAFIMQIKQGRESLLYL
jgi:hypothetical protein